MCELKKKEVEYELNDPPQGFFHVTLIMFSPFYELFLCIDLFRINIENPWKKSNQNRRIFIDLDGWVTKQRLPNEGSYRYI